MKPNIENNIKTIQFIEKKISCIKYFEPKKIYVNHENLWIKYAKWPFGAYKLLSKISGISAFPEKRLEYWLDVFKNKGKGIKKRIGLFLNFPFKKTIELPLNADFYFDKDCFGILVYINQPEQKVIKFNQVSDIDSLNKIKREAESLKIANEIEHKTVKTPKLLNTFFEEKIYFFEQDLILAKDLHSLSKKEQNRIYNEVFDFMFLLYKNSEVTLKTPKKEEDSIVSIVENYLKEIDDGQEIVNNYKKLLAKNKKMLLGKIHGDLSLNNILTNNRKSCFWIIDWGESDRDYLAKDLKNNAHCAMLFYVKLVAFFNFDKKQLYSLEEQIFIANYDAITKMIIDFKINKRPDSFFVSKMDTYIKNMVCYNG